MLGRAADAAGDAHERRVHSPAPSRRSPTAGRPTCAPSPTSCRRMRDRGGGDPISALAALLAPDGAPLDASAASATSCGCTARAATARSRRSSRSWPKRKPLTLTEISQRLQRTPGSTKDYLSWLEDVDLVTSRQKRYSFTDPLLRVWVRLHCRADAARRRRPRPRGPPLRAAAPAAAARAGAGHGRRRRAAEDGQEALGNYRDRLRIGESEYVRRRLTSS